MKKGLVALFALIMLASCCNNKSAKKNDKCCATTTKSEKACSSSKTKSPAACSNDCGSCASSCSTKSVSNEAGVVEVLYMHGKQRCATCVAIGKEAEAYIKSLGNDKVVIKTVDFSTPAGEKIADKYEVASSSLLVVKGGKVDNLTSMSFQYARNNPEQFKKNLGASIKKMLN